MHRKFITLVLSAAIAVTGITAPPAQAGDDDVAKWIAGLAALAIVGAAISDGSKGQAKPRQSHTHTPKHGVNQGHAGGYTVVHPKPVRSHRKALPAHCRVTEHVQGHKIRGFNRHCLRRNHVNVKALPNSCKVRLHDQHRNHTKVLFTSRCLRQNGYHLAH